MAIFTSITAALVGAGMSAFMAGATIPAIDATHKEFACTPKRKEAQK
ncbi:hypothetical protein [Devosia sp. 1635]|nr:hypothetical protein [Devosia sp. 1635]